MSINNTLDSLIPISRFNKGEANKIFDEVKESGCKIVVKNNVPACVLITPERYKEIIEMMEDLHLLSVVAERERNDTGYRISFEDVLAKDGRTLADIEDVPMEYGVDFE